MIHNNSPFENGIQHRQPEAMEQSAVVEKLYNLKQVEEIASGNEEFILTLVNIFLETVPVNCTEMVEASQAAQWDKVSKLAHKIKSTIDTMEIISIGTDIRTIEHDAKKEINLENIKKLVVKVTEVIENTSIQLKQEFSL